MEIVNLKVSDIKEYEKNPRKNDVAVDSVAQSIKDYGFKNPILIDKDNVVICGHTRLRATKKLKMKTIPCIVADDLTEAQIKALRVADNKVAERSIWDMELLKGELEELKDLGVELEDLGFLDFELDSILGENINVDDFFADKGEFSENEKKKVKCPECGQEFTL